MLVTQDEPLIERFFREADARRVLTSVSGTEGVMPLEFLEIELLLAEVFDKVEFQPSGYAGALA